MNKQTYDKAYQYIRMQRYFSVLEAATDYDHFSPCSQCDWDCPDLDRCQQSAEDSKYLEMVAAKRIITLMKALKMELSQDEIEIARSHYFAPCVESHSKIHEIANNFALAYPENVLKSKLSHSFFSTADYYKHSVYVERWKWHGYFYNRKNDPQRVQSFLNRVRRVMGEFESG